MPRAPWRALQVLALAGAASLMGCASDYVARTQGARAAYQAYQPDRALAQFEKEREGRDQLLVLLDEGMVLHAAGRYPESIEKLSRADRLAQDLDVVSVSEQAATLVANEREKAYRGEDFEKLLVSVLQALNYGALGKDEDALVEVRRVDERLRKMVVEENKPYEQLAIARYLGGVLYEDQGDADAAFIDYQQAQKLNPDLGPLAEPLLRLARETERDTALAELRARYPGIDAPPLRRDEGQVVVLVEAGLSPEKEETQRRERVQAEVKLVALPSYRSRWAHAAATVTAGGRTQAAVTVTSLDGVARQHLQERIGRMLLKSVAGTAVKAGIGAGVAKLTDSEGAGLATFLLLSLLNHADLRSWLSLPAEFQIARFRLPAGKQRVAVAAGGLRSEHEVEVRPGRVALLVLRRY